MKKPRKIDSGIFVLITIIGFLILGFIILSSLKMLLKIGWLFAF